jgi:hypothetical protein
MLNNICLFLRIIKKPTNSRMMFCISTQKEIILEKNVTGKGRGKWHFLRDYFFLMEKQSDQPQNNRAIENGGAE